jgi:hypothetical protein
MSRLVPRPRSPLAAAGCPGGADAPRIAATDVHAATTRDRARRRRTWAVPFVLLGLLPGCSAPGTQAAQSSHQQPAGAVTPITVDSTEEQIRHAIETARVGRKLTPKSWPNGARVAVCLSFDVDNE